MQMTFCHKTYIGIWLAISDSKFANQKKHNYENYKMESDTTNRSQLDG
jgi:hypothetical protein